MDVKAELEREQAVLDLAAARLIVIRAEAEAVAAEVRAVGAGGTRQGRLERDIRVTNAARRLSRLNVGNQPLVIGRIDREDGQTWRVGRLSIDDADREPLVVDWRAAAAQPFYRATPLDNCGVVRRRHYEYLKDHVFRGERVGRRLSGMQDELLGAEGYDGSDLVLVGEGALLAALGRRRSGRMADIVATIQREQDEVIRAPLGGVLVVQGGPGTGKTAVALHRAAYLLYAHPVPLDTTGLLLVGPNPLFLRYVEHVLPSLGEHTVTLSTPAGLVDGLQATRADSSGAARVKGDLRMVEVIARARALLCRPLREDLVVNNASIRLVLTVEASRAIVTSARRRAGSHAQRRRLVEKLVLDALVAEQSAARRRLHLAGRLSAEAAAGDPVETGRLRRELLGRPEVRAALGRMWPALDGADVVRAMWSSPALLTRAARDLLEDDELAILGAGAGAGAGADGWTPADVALVDEARALIGPPVAPESAPGPGRAGPSGPEAEAQAELIERVMSDSAPECPKCGAELSWSPASRRWTCGTGGCDGSWRPEQVLSPEQQQLFESVLAHMTGGIGRGEEAAALGVGADRIFGHVLVDEAQELSPMQWRMLARRCPSRSLTVTGDLAQASGAWAAAAWADALAPALEGSTVPWSISELTVNYRTPQEVMDLAAGLLEAAGGGSPPQSVRRAGVEPVLIPVPAGPFTGEVSTAGPSAFALDTAVAAARHLAGALAGGRIGIIVPSPLVGPIRSRLAGAAGAADYIDLEAPIVVLDVVTSKGLEFDGVVVVDPGALMAEQPRGMAALYVAATRTTRALCFIGGQDLPVLAGVTRAEDASAYVPEALEDVGSAARAEGTQTRGGGR